MTGVLWCCFAVSGASALALEMLWMRSAGLVLGATAPTAGTVLACYFAGLGLGAAAARSGARRPVRRYGLLELGVAAGAVWSVVVFAALATDGGGRMLAALGTPGRIAAIAVALLPSTVCLGATLPALGQALAGAGGAGTSGGRLYALNTLGAALGAALAGFGLPAIIGVRASYGVAAAASSLAGALALAIGEPTPAPAETSTPAPPMPAAQARLRLVAGGAGFLGLGLEVLWTRLMAQVLHNSVYSFTAVALVFLLAIAAGAWLAAMAVRRARPESVAAGALVAAGVSTIAGFWLFVRGTDGLGYVGMSSGLPEYLVRIVALAAVTAGPAALASAAVLPAAWAAWGRRDDAARPLGDLAAANTVGGLAGAVLAGFVAVPTIGIRGSLLLAAVAYVVLADVMLAGAGRLRALGYAALLAIVVANPLQASLVSLHPGESVRTILEGPHGIVSVVATKDDLQLRLDNYYVLGGSAAAANERRQGLVPLLVHPAPRRVAFIGLATGTTASAAPALGVEQTTVVELVPEVASAARTHFAPWNAGLLERPDVRLVIDDGRRWLAATDEHFDVIVSDLFIPWHPGAGSLYAREMYETAARRLASGGLFCQWLPLYQLTRQEFDVIVHTFLDVFPETRLWRDDFYPDRPVVALVGQLAPGALDLERVQARLDRLPGWARDPLLASVRGLVMLYVGALQPVADLFQDGATNSDDRPVIEFLAPRLTRMSAAGDKDWFTGERLGTFYDTLEARLDALPDALLPSSDSVLNARRAGTRLYDYALAAARGEGARRATLEAEVRTLVPDVITAAEDERPGTQLAEGLAGLRAAQDDVRRRIEDMERRLGQLSGGDR